MNLFVKNFFIFFFIVLVISITPGFAVKVGENFNYKDTEMILSDLDKKNNDLDALLNEINDHTSRIYDSMNYIMTNSLKFWKYGQVLDHIKLITTEVNSLIDLAGEVTGIANVIKSDTIKLDESLNDGKFNNSYSDEEFFKEVENRSNTTFDIVDPSNFKKGDIVQYKSQRGNNKYLQYVEIDNKTSYVILLNSAYKKIALSQEFFNKTATKKISPKTPNNQIIRTIYNLQLENINDTKNLAQNKLQAAQELKKSGDKLSAIGGIFGMTGFFLGIIGGMLVAAGPWGCYPLVIVGCILIVISGIFIAIYGGLIGYSGSFLEPASKWTKDAKNKLKDTEALEKDLSESLNSFPFAADMNLTTPTAVSINGTLNGTDFDGNNLTYAIVDQPKHGILDISENGSFKYTPNNNFTGNESFKYKVNDGIVDSNIATVNITVLSIAKIILNNIKGKVGDRVNLTATLLNNNGKGIANATVIFKINNTIIGQTKTNEKGIAILNNYVLKVKGKFALSAIFLGNPLYSTTNKTISITIEPRK